jgi:endonuclease/exonuclease/phosphatase (EEP) superfamily protein YafD
MCTRQSKAMNASVLILLLFGCAESCSANPTRVSRNLLPGEANLKVLTYNVNFGLGGHPAVIEAIAGSEAGVVFLEETTPEWERAIRNNLSARYPYMEFRSWSGAGGLAILSKYKTTQSELIRPPEQGWFPALRVVIDSPIGLVQALVVHLHPKISDSGSVVSGYFSTGSKRLEEIQTHSSYLDPTLPTLILGDCNEGRGGEALEYLVSLGYQDALTEFQPDQPTWRWKTSVGTLTSQFDHVLYNRRLEPVSLQVMELGPSDHLPVVGVFVSAKDLRQKP